MDDKLITLDRIICLAIYLIFILTNRHTFLRIIYTGLFASNVFSIIKNKSTIKLKSILLLIFNYLVSYFLIKDPNPFYYLISFWIPMPNFFRAIFIIIFISYFFNNHLFKVEGDNGEDKSELKEESKENHIKEDEKKEKGEEIKENEEKKENIEKVENEEKKGNVENKEKEDIKEENKENKEKEEIKEFNKEKDKEIKEKAEIKEEKVLLTEIKNRKKYFLSREIKFFWDNKLSLLNLFVALILLRIFIYFYDFKFWIFFANKEKLLSFNTNTNITNSSNLTNNKTVYYISSIVYNIEPIIKDWIDEMKKLIDYLGPENVIISIYENGDSTDKTRKYLNFFESYLINNKVTNVVNMEKIEEKEGVDRIRFLARLRNKSLDLLYQIADLDFSNTKIIFFNDILFRFEDIIKLLATNNGNYDSVCAMDYYDSFYDTWASIGLDGKQFRRYFPYMYNKEQQDAYINGEPIRTFSCWNGVTVINAKPFEDRNKLFFRTGRKIRQSECTLLHADMYFMGYRKVLVNTQVAVAYTYEYYYKNHYLYPWTKNLFTYFYYYFKYGFIKRNYNLTNLVDENIDMDDDLDQVVLEYMIK